MGTNYKIGVAFDARNAAKTAADIGKVDRALNNIGKGGSGSFSGNFSADLASTAIQKLTSLAFEGGKAIFDYSARMEQTKIGFATLMNGAENANKHLEELKKFAVDTPFDFETLAKASRRLQNVGLEAAKIIPLMRDIGNAAAAAGASSEELDGITLAFSQIIAKGKVSAEEVNQLAERGIPVWEMLSKTFGKSKAEIIKLSEAGKISSDIFLQAFQNFSKAKFGDAMDKQSKTFNGAWSSIKDMTIQTAATLFEPVYDETSKFAVKFSQSLQAQLPEAKSAGEKFGFAFGEAVGDGIRRSQVDWASIAVRGMRLATSQGFSGFMLELSKMLTDDAGKGFGEGLLKGLKTPTASIADLRKLDDAIQNVTASRADLIKFAQSMIAANPALQKIAGNIKDIKTESAKIPTFEETLAAEKAEKQTKALRDAIGDLTSRVAFYGQETEVAALKQKLINQGVTDFQSAVAKSALSLAAQFDKLKSAKKAQEEYNGKLKDASGYLTDLRADAEFEMRFPDATELQKFERWVKNTGDNFRELRSQIEATRSTLELAAVKREVNSLVSLNAAEMSRVAKVIETQINPNLSEMDAELRSIAANLGLKGIVDNFKIDVSDSFFSSEVQKFVNEFKKLEALNDFDGLSRLQNNFKKFLTSFKNSNGSDIIGDKEDADNWIDYFLRLDAAVNKTSLKRGLVDLDNVLSDLGLNIAGFGAKTELQKFDEWLADENVTRAVAERAAAINMTADALKELLHQQKAAQLAAATRPRIVGQTDQKNPFGEGFAGEIGVQKITTEAEMIANVYTKLGATVGGVVNDLAGAMGELVQNWVLYGNASGMNARKAIASALAMAAAQSSVSAIMETAYGIAALTPWGAAIYDPAPLHFKAAALFATIAAGTALAGRAVAGNSFNNGGTDSSNAGQPDYQPVNSPPVRESNRRFSTTSGGEYTAIFEGLREEIAGLRSIVKASRPGDVLVNGANERPGFIAERFITDVKRNGSKATEAGKALRLS